MNSSSFAGQYNTIRQLHDAFDRKVLSPIDLVKNFLNSIQNSHLGAYLTVCEERAIQQAQKAEAVLSKEKKVPREKMPLFGIPLGIKDILTIEGVRTTCASKILDNYIPPYTATAVEKLEAAGAITLGKLNLDEFAMGSSNENSAYGPVKHPTHPERVPGGSSGGSAAAVKAGLCVASLGTDTGGSIRLPASFCGVVGVKPTYGRISRYGQIAFASSLDQIGPLTHTVEDAAILLDVMSGHDPRDSTSAQKNGTQAFLATSKKPDWSRLRIGIPKEYEMDGISPAVEKSVQKALKWFENQGAQLIPISLPHTKYAIAVYYLVAMSEASSNLSRFDGVRFGVRPPRALEARDLADFYKASRAALGPEVKRRILLGTFALSGGYSEAYYGRACQVRRLIKQDFDKAFNEVDMIVGPVSPTTAFRLGEKITDPLQMYLNDIFTIPASLAGLPAMSLPCGKDGDGLPVGVHFISPQFDEERLFSIAHAFFGGVSHAS